MIAWAGAERLALGLTDTLDTPPQARWPLADVTSRTHGRIRDAQRGRRMSFQRIAVVGAGAWGTALANVIARAGRTVTLAARNQAGAAAIAARAARARTCRA